MEKTRKIQAAKIRGKKPLAADLESCQIGFGKTF